MAVGTGPGSDGGQAHPAGKRRARRRRGKIVPFGNLLRDLAREMLPERELAADCAHMQETGQAALWDAEDRGAADFAATAPELSRREWLARRLWARALAGEATATRLLLLYMEGRPGAAGAAAPDGAGAQAWPPSPEQVAQAMAELATWEAEEAGAGVSESGGEERAGRAGRMGEPASAGGAASDNSWRHGGPAGQGVD